MTDDAQEAYANTRADMGARDRRAVRQLQNFGCMLALIAKPTETPEQALARMIDEYRAMYQRQREAADAIGTVAEELRAIAAGLRK